MVIKDLVSVIMPVYNRERMIGDAIDSVLSQSYSNLELIIIDDGSTDNTKGIINRFHDDRILLIETDHSGPYIARNSGIENSRGEHIAFLDSDDIWLPEKLAKQIALAGKKQVGLIFTNGFVFTESENEYQIRPFLMQLYLNGDSGRYRGKRYTELLSGHNYIATSSVMLGRHIIDDVGYFLAEKRGVLDYEMWLRIARKYEIDFIEQPLFIYKAHSESLSADRAARRLDELYVYRLQEAWCAEDAGGDEEKVVKRAISETGMRLGLTYYNTGKGVTARKYLVKALTSKYTDLLSRVWSLACILLPYPVYRRLYTRYTGLRTKLRMALGDRITPGGFLKYIVVTLLNRIFRLK